MAINSRGVFEATDQASITFVESQAAKIEPTAHEEALVDIQYPELVPMYTDMDVADDMLISYISRPGTGRMTPLANGATDIPRTDIEYDVMTRQAFASGLAYGWDDMEIERAQKLGRSLAADKVKAAYRVAEEEKERTVLFGNTSYGWPGIIGNQLGNGQEATIDNDNNNTNTTFTDNPNSPHVFKVSNQWHTQDGPTIFEDIRKAFDVVFAGSDKVEVPDTLLLPNRASTFLFKPLSVAGSVTTMSLWDYIQQNNPYTKMYSRPMVIKMVNELDQGTNGVRSKAILYSSNMRTLRFIMPQDLTFLPPQRVAWTQTFYGRMKLGGVQYLRPKSMCVITNIGGTR